MGGFAQLPWFESQWESLGPFEAAWEGYEAAIRLHMKRIASREMGSHLPPADHYLSFLWRDQWVPSRSTRATVCDPEFYLRHHNDKGDHILVDDEHSITGIIDWESSLAEDFGVAFSAPSMMWPADKFSGGDNALSEDEVRFADLFDNDGYDRSAQAVREGRFLQRFLSFLRGETPRDFAELERLFQQRLRPGGGAPPDRTRNPRSSQSLRLRTTSWPVMTVPLSQMMPNPQRSTRRRPGRVCKGETCVPAAG